MRPSLPPTASAAAAAPPEAALSHRELLTAAFVWVFFGVLSGISQHGTIPLALYLVAAALTSLGAAIAWRGRPVAGFHVAAAVTTAAVALFSLLTGQLSDGALALVLIPVLATYVSSATSGLVWLLVVGTVLLTVRVAIEAAWVTPLFQPLPTLREPTLLALAAVTWLFAARARARSDTALERVRRIAAEAEARADDLTELKRELEETNQQLDEVAGRLAESAKEVAEANLALEDARDAAVQRAKEAVHFLTRMSHEIRTPLNGVLGITDVLLGGKLEREARELVTIIESSGRVLRRLVDEVLDLARLDAGKLQLVEESFDPLTIAEDVADLFAAQAAAKGVVLVTVAPEHLPMRLIGDPMRVRQVLQNLVGNAVKFTTTGHVRIDMRLERTFLTYRVEDTGTGLSPEALGALFSEYTQGHEGARRGGSGLGLVIAQRLARAMNGDVTAESVLGEGSVFVATFGLTRATTGRGVASADELSGALTTAGLLCRDPLVALALRRTAEHVNIRLIALDDPSQEHERSLALIYTDGPSSPRHPNTPHVRLRFPSDETGTGEGPAQPTLLMPPRRARLVRITRQTVGRARETLVRRTAQPKGLSALVVDDEPVNRKVATLLLSREGWTVTSAASGGEALARLEQGEQVDAVLLDLDMPDLDGIETARAITQQTFPGRRPWLVLQTASVEEAARARARRAGVTDFLPKPIETDQLQAVILRAERHRRLEAHRAQRSLARPSHDPATHAAVTLVEPVAVAIVYGELDVALAQLGELQALARRRQLDRIDRCCSALHDALLESEGLEALVDLEEAVWLYAREASTDHDVYEI